MRTGDRDELVVPALVRAPDRGDEFAAWLRPHLALLSALAVREVGFADAEDVVQEALIRAWRRRSTFRPERGTPRAWLAGIVLDRARRHRVRSRRAPATRADEPRPSVADLVDLDAAVRALPRRQRQVTTLHYLLGFRVAEVADALGISSGSVKSHLFDARAALRRRLEDR